MSDKYPKFRDGDVRINLVDGLLDLQLHSLVLSLHSEWFKACLSERWNQGDGAKGGWDLELRFDKGTTLATLVRASQSSSIDSTTEMVSLPSKPTSEQETLYQERLDIVSAYASMFRVIYHLGAVPDSTFDKAQQQLARLREVSILYLCERTIAPFIKLSLLSRRLEALHSCRQRPTKMLELAAKLECPWLLKEAATRLIGSAEEIWSEARAAIEAAKLLPLLQKKRAQMIRQLVKVDLDLFRNKPKSEHQMMGEQVAEDFYRHYLAMSLAGGEGAYMRSGYSGIYRELQEKRGASYWTSWILDYLGEVGYEGESVPIDQVVNCLGGILDEACEAAGVAGILVDTTELKVQGEKDDLTFIEFGDEGMPWKDSVAKEADKMASVRPRIAEPESG